MKAVKFAIVAAAAAAGMGLAMPASAQSSNRYPTMLKNTYWVYHTMSVPEDERPADAPPSSEVLPKHLEYQFMLEETGVMFGAGPFANADGSPAGGLIIIRAKDEAEARAIADNDPMHKAGLRRYELHQWTVHEGQMRITVDFSTGNYNFE